MRIHLLKHVSFENGAYIEDWIKANNHSFTVTNFFMHNELPGLNDFDWLIIMGGPMGIYDEDKYDWLKKEKQFIKAAIAGEKIVLGICLGSQLIADALGAKVRRNKFKEIGWFPISKTEEGRNNYFMDSFPDNPVVFHWHGDTFDIPEGAVHLAKSEACTNQAFIYKDKVVGLQFHSEVTEASLKELTEYGNKELIENNYIQSEREILENIKHCDTNNSFLDGLLNRLSENFSCKAVDFSK